MKSPGAAHPCDLSVLEAEIRDQGYPGLHHEYIVNYRPAWSVEQDFVLKGCVYMYEKVNTATKIKVFYNFNPIICVFLKKVQSLKLKLECCGINRVLALTLISNNIHG